MREVHILAPLPVPDWYPEYLERSQNATHWAGMIRVQEGDENPVPDEWVLATIETDGENTYGAMLEMLSPEQMAAFRQVHPAEVAKIGDDGVAVKAPTGPIVTFSGGL